MYLPYICSRLANSEEYLMTKKTSTWRFSTTQAKHWVRFAMRCLCLCLMMCWCASSDAAVDSELLNDTTNQAKKELQREENRLRKEANKQKNQTIKERREAEALAKKNRFNKDANKKAKEQSQMELAEKKAKKKVEQHENDSLKQEKKKLDKKIRKEEKRQDSLEYANSRKKSKDDGVNRDSLKEDARLLKEAKKYLLKDQRDSLKLEAALALMPRSKYKSWSKHFGTFKMLPALHEINHQIYLTPYDTLLSGHKKKGKMLRLFNDQYAWQNNARSYAIHAFENYRHISDSLLRIAETTDSVYMEKQPRFQGMNRYKLQLQRSDAREKRLWKHIGQLMKTHALTDTVEFRENAESSFSQFLKRDSIYSEWYDSLKARNLWQQFSFRFNAVSWVLGVPHVGIEFDLSGSPRNSTSIMIEGYLKPRIKWGTSKMRFSYNINAIAGEIRHYWRTGGKQTIQGKIDNRDYQGEAGFPEVHDYHYHHSKKDSLKHHDEHGAPSYEAVGVMAPHLKRDTVPGSHRKIVYENEKGDTIKTASLFKRWWQPFHYNKLSGRYVHHPHFKRLYYIGLRAGYEKYQWLLGSAGRQGKDAYAAITFGYVRQLASFRGGSYLNLDLGAGVGVEYNSYSKFAYDSDYSCYKHIESHAAHITPYPVIKDLHVSLVYTFRSLHHKTNNIFHIKDFGERMDRVVEADEVHKEQKKDQYIWRHEKKVRKYFARQKEKGEMKNYRAERQKARAEKHNEDSLARLHDKAEKELIRQDKEKAAEERKARAEENKKQKVEKKQAAATEKARIAAEKQQASEDKRRQATAAKKKNK